MRDVTTSNNHSSTVRYYGYIPDLLDELFWSSGLTYELYVVSDGSYGNRVSSTGQWDGMIGELQSGVSSPKRPSKQCLNSEA